MGIRDSHPALPAFAYTRHRATRVAIQKPSIRISIKLNTRIAMILLTPYVFARSTVTIGEGFAGGTGSEGASGSTGFTGDSGFTWISPTEIVF